MRDAALVRRTDRIRQRDGQGQHAIERQTVFRNHLGERLAVDELERQERDAVDFFDRVNGDDVGVVERRDRAGLTLEPLAPVGVARQLTGQDLEGDPALEAGVVGEVNLTHSPLSQQFYNSIVPEGRADHVVKLPR